MNKYFCDHCGVEINSRNDFIDMDIETLEDYYRADLCEKCRVELAKMQDELVKEFLAYQGINNTRLIEEG